MTPIRPEKLTALIDRAGKIVPVQYADVFCIEEGSDKYQAISGRENERFEESFLNHLEEGIVDWAFAENRPVVIEDLEFVGSPGDERNFIIIPLHPDPEVNCILMVHTSKPKSSFTNDDLDRLVDVMD